jgi:glutathione S-transferase
MFKLYGAYGSASLAPHLILALSGAAYEFCEIDLAAERPAFLKRLNPSGKVPVLVTTAADGQDESMYEAAAICIHLADLLPAAQAAPLPTARERGRYLQWMSLLSIGLQEQFYNAFYPERYATTEEAIESSRLQALRKIEQTFLFIDSQLEGRRTLAGPTVLACDLYLLMLISWQEDREGLFRRAPRLKALFEHLLEHPVVAHVFARYDA